MRATSWLQLCSLLLGLLVAAVDCQQAKECAAVSDAIVELPKDLQDLLKKRMDVYSFKGTVFLPSSAAWTGRDLDSRIYRPVILEKIIDFGIIPGVRFAERPGLKSGTEQLDSRFQDSRKLLCLNADRPSKMVSVELQVTGTPSANDSTRFGLEGTPGNTYTAGGGQVTIVRVYSNVNIGSAHWDKKNVTRRPGVNVTGLANWAPASVVKVVQCKNADVFITDHLLLPCPLCGQKCSAYLVSGVVTVMLPVLSGLVACLALAGFLAICCGCNACAHAEGCCACLWKCICRSLVLIVVAVELFIAATFAGFAWYFNRFMGKQAVVGQQRWRVYFIWSVVGSILTGIIVITQLWAFFAQAAKRRRSKQHQQFFDAPPPPPIYQPVGAMAPMRA